MAAEHAHEALTHAAAHDIPELPNVITVLSERWHDHPLVSWLHHWENLVFAALVAFVLCLITWRYSRRPSTIPRGGQNVLELLVEGVDNFIRSVLGDQGRQFTPFIGTLFLYIWFMNLIGLVPGMKSPTSSLNTTIALAVTVFLYVQWTGLKRLGLLGYMDHLAGQPRDVVGWCMVPLMLPIHLLGELIKPLSLSLRLGFNVFAEDVLLAVLVGLGVTAGLMLHLPIGIPIQLFVVPLGLIFSTVQALVVSLVTSVYISQMLPHGEHHERTDIRYRPRQSIAGI